jgi:hypothetical protein
LTNVGRLNILVDDEIYERFDITKWFWELYKSQRAIQRLAWDLTQAAHKRKQLGMLTEAAAVEGDDDRSSQLPDQAFG